MSDGSPPVLPTKKHLQHLELYSEADVPTDRGVFRMVVFRDRRNGDEHVAMVSGEVVGLEGVPVRIHSECLTSEVFGSLKCDCRQQLDRALDFIAQNERGVVLYLRQEGRGIGLGNKIKAYALQNKGSTPTRRTGSSGSRTTCARYDIAAEMLRALGVKSVDLITNNPLKIAGLVEEGIPVRRRIPSRTEHNPHNVDYLRTKRDRSGHLLEVASDEPADEDEEIKAG